MNTRGERTPVVQERPLEHIHPSPKGQRPSWPLSEEKTEFPSRDSPKGGQAWLLTGAAFELSSRPQAWSQSRTQGSEALAPFLHPGLRPALFGF